MLHKPAPWHFDISVIYPKDFSQICYNTPIRYIAAIFVKYCYTTGSWLFCLQAKIRCSGCSPLGEKIIVKQDCTIAAYATAPCITRPSAAITLIECNVYILAFHGSEFQQHLIFQCREMVLNANTFWYFLRKYQHNPFAAVLYIDPSNLILYVLEYLYHSKSCMCSFHHFSAVLPRDRQAPKYSGRTRSIPQLLMPRLLASPVHQQQQLPICLR